MDEECSLLLATYVWSLQAFLSLSRSLSLSVSFSLARVTSMPGMLVQASQENWMIYCFPGCYQKVNRTETSKNVG